MTRATLSRKAYRCHGIGFVAGIASGLSLVLTGFFQHPAQTLLLGSVILITACCVPVIIIRKLAHSPTSAYGLPEAETHEYEDSSRRLWLQILVAIESIMFGAFGANLVGLIALLVQRFVK